MKRNQDPVDALAAAGGVIKLDGERRTRYETRAALRKELKRLRAAGKDFRGRLETRTEALPDGTTRTVAEFCFEERELPPGVTWQGGSLVIGGRK
ncbi:MAG: hypothetical protein GC160_19875 [Acidobacteria bacterium]|nr:hypothetical protein [Acidobacteriota bacterium]